jgi:cytochrome c5
MMRSLVLRAVAMLAAGLLAASCEEHRFDPPDRAGRALQAESEFDAGQFDSIQWSGDSARAFFGNEVYTRKCRACHGFLGEGDTEYGRNRGVAPPSLVRASWPAGDSVPLLRRRVFAGHPAGMPTFGVGGLTPREVDAAAYYIARVLRPEVLGTAPR